ncbi:MAG: hypothetical protein FWG61_08925 [Firmicutes bacterium]|nr:hypothetical protein [Bacillota bacterium]
MFITYSEVMVDDVTVEGIRGTVKKAWAFVFAQGLPKCSGDTIPIRIIKLYKPKINFRDLRLKPAS